MDCDLRTLDHFKVFREEAELLNQTITVNLAAATIKTGDIVLRDKTLSQLAQGRLDLRGSLKTGDATVNVNLPKEGPTFSESERMCISTPAT